MTRLITYIAAVVAALAGSLHTAAAANLRSEARCSLHQTAKVELACGRRAFHRDASAARWVRNHRILTVVLSTNRSRHNLKYYLWRKRVDRGWIKQARTRLRTTAEVAHYALWMCIHGDEAQDWHDQNTGGNGHYGGLQMTPNWGWNQYAHYGLSGNPANYSEAAQIAAAERGYRANHYSQAWLLSQWDHPDCLRYA